MDENSLYHQQVRLLVQVLSFVDAEPCFALKGGTAINLFVRNMPRLSVDIDLVFLPLLNREESLAQIHIALDRVASALENSSSDLKVLKAYQTKADALRLLVSNGRVQIKVELSPVLRGVVNACERKSVVEIVERNFGYAEMTVVSLEDLYAGKICAALDRQHPRDLFDIQVLLENEGLTEQLRKVLLIYLLSHARPLEELLAPNRMNIDEVYFNEFEGMAFIDISLKQLLNAREQLISLINESLTISERQFLLSFHEGEPDWNLLEFENIQALPAIQWKLLNLKKMNKEKQAISTKKLQGILRVTK